MDTEKALARLNQNRALYGRMLERWLQESLPKVTRARTLLHDGERKAARHLIHNLKGLSGNLAAERIFLIASKLDTALKGDDDIDEKLFDRLEQAFDEVVPSIRKLTETGPGKEEPTVTKDPEDPA